MTDVGVEVGQKMRLAIKAKLSELNCYVDDELPDYIMVMIANKRTKSQMKEDLSLFLSTETSFFVEWLHIVLKKLKQVHVTNPNVFQNPIKRKCNELIPQVDHKKVKNENSKIKMENLPASCKSLTDDLPITANRLTEEASRRKIILFEEPHQSSSIETFSHEDDFDIPLLSEINAFNEDELELLEKKIKSVKSRLGLQVESDKEEEEKSNNETNDGNDCFTIKAEPDVMKFSGQFRNSSASKRIISPQTTIKRTESLKQIELKPSIHARIIFDNENNSFRDKVDSIMKRNANCQNRHEGNGKIVDTFENKKRSILDRLGKRTDKIQGKVNRLRTIPSKVVKPEKWRNSDKKYPASILNTVGVLSKVSIPQRKMIASQCPEERISQEDEEGLNSKNVASVVKIKPRVLPEKTKQANPNLLFKAVADAQRSVCQTPEVGKSRHQVKEKQNLKSAPALFTKKYKDQMAAALRSEPKTIIFNKNRKAKILDGEKLKLRFLLSQKQHELHFNTDPDTDFTDDIDMNIERSLGTPDLQRINKEIYFKSQISIEQKNYESTLEDASKNNDKSDLSNDSRNGTAKSNHTFIVTLDGIDQLQFPHNDKLNVSTPTKQGAIIKTRRLLSPIIFDAQQPATSTTTKTVINKADDIAFTQGKKSMEKCKYFPNCRNGDRCEFMHPGMCKMFPNCKFAEMCVYSHPTCKFEMSCTRKNCPYNHITSNKIGVAVNSQSHCKYFPNCSNGQCPYSHQKYGTLCKYGIHCKNAVCAFQHPKDYPGRSGKLTWHLAK